MNIAIIGLGLIGGSLARTIKHCTAHTVYGCDLNPQTIQQAYLMNAIDHELTDEALRTCDMVLVSLYPHAIVEWVKAHAADFRPGCLVIDCGGVKQRICSELVPLARAGEWHYLGGHPMAGKEVAGFDHAEAALYKGASMILVPTQSTAEGEIEELTDLFLRLGFGMVKVCDKYEHDRMIAHTSQLCHVVSNCYVKSPSSPNHKGFSAGSYRDMIRVAGVNEVLWTDLFLTNRDALLGELDIFIGDLLKVRKALAEEDEEEMQKLLREGRLIREAIVE